MKIPILSAFRKTKTDKLITVKVRQPWLIFTLYQISLVLLILIFVYLNNKQYFSFNIIIDRLGRWDGGHYIFIAQNGYVKYWDKNNLIVFPPLYPVLIKALSLVLSNLYISAVTITAISSIIGYSVFSIFLSKVLNYPRIKTLRVLLLFIFSPIGVFFALTYAESLYFMLSILFFYFLYRNKLTLASIFGFLLTLTKLQGILIVLPFSLYMIRESIKSFNLSSVIRNFIGISIVVSGFLIYLLINLTIYKDPLYFSGRLKNYWSKTLVNPIPQYVNNFKYTKILVKQNKIGPVTVDFISVLVAPVIFITYLILQRKKLLPIELILWTAANIILVSSQSWWLSSTRYICLIFPLFIMVESLLWKYKPLYFLTLAVFFWLFISGVTNFAQGAWNY